MLGICFILFVIQVIAMQLVFSVSLQARYPRRKHIMLNAIQQGVMSAVVYIRVKSEVDSVENYIGLAAAIVVFIVFLAILYTDKWWKKILLFLIMYMGENLADIACNELLHRMGIQWEIERNSETFLKSMIIGTIFTLVILCIVAIIWKCLFQKEKRKKLYTIVIGIMIILQLLIMNRATRWMALDLDVNLRHEYTIIAVSALISDVIFALLILEERRNIRMDERLKELEYIKALEARHYHAIEEKEEKLSKIRHDFKNQITTAYNLFNLADKEQAEQMLREMTSRLHESEIRTYSSNAIINAVMQEKAKLCEEKQIKLDSTIRIGETDGIKMVHMCSVFSNLLDNAIRATEAYKNGEKYIKVNAKKQGDYFVISVKNASDKPVKRVSERKGYGREILKDIATQYNGESNYHWENDEYCASVTLLGNE